MRIGGRHGVFQLDCYRSAGRLARRENHCVTPRARPQPCRRPHRLSPRGLLFTKLGLRVVPDVWGELITAVVGAVVLLFLLQVIRRA